MCGAMKNLVDQLRTAGFRRAANVWRWDGSRSWVEIHPGPGAGHDVYQAADRLPGWVLLASQATAAEAVAAATQAVASQTHVQMGLFG